VPFLRPQHRKVLQTPVWRLSEQSGRIAVAVIGGAALIAAVKEVGPGSGQ
jgi:hypothetical protein